MKQKWKRFHLTMKALFHYLLAVLFALIFALYCSGRVGWFLILMLTLAPVISVIYMLLGAWLLEFSFETPEEILNKGEKCILTVHIRNKSILPTAPLRLQVLDTPALFAEQKKMVVEVLPLQTTTLEIPFTARYSGAAQVGIGSVRISDFFSFFSKEVLPNRGKNLWSVGIVPEVGDIPFEEEYIRAVSQCAIGNDESEETMEYSSAVFGGFPGYDHRVYQPGDPIKRINWKLSAGKEELMVRLDEVKAGAGVTLILDPCMDSMKEAGAVKTASQYMNITDEEAADLLKQNSIEAALGHVRVLIGRELSVVFYAKLGGKWSCAAVMDEDSLGALTRSLAVCSFAGEEPERIPSEILTGEVPNNAILYCTPVMGTKLMAQLTQCKSEDCTVALYNVLSEEGVVL